MAVEVQLPLEGVVPMVQQERNILRSKVLAVQSILEMAENQANYCQDSGRSQPSQIRIGPFRVRSLVRSPSFLLASCFVEEKSAESTARLIGTLLIPANLNRGMTNFGA